MCRDDWVPASGAEGALVGSPGVAELSSAIEANATRWGPGVAFQFHAGCGDEIPACAASMAAPRVSASTVALRTRTSNGYPPNWQMRFKASGNGDFAGSRVNTGTQYSPGTIVLSTKADVPASDTYVTYSGFPAFSPG